MCSNVLSHLLYLCCTLGPEVKENNGSAPSCSSMSSIGSGSDFSFSSGVSLLSKFCLISCMIFPHEIKVVGRFCQYTCLQIKLRHTPYLVHYLCCMHVILSLSHSFNIVKSSSFFYPALLFLRINFQSGIPRSQDPMARKDNKGS